MYKVLIAALTAMFLILPVAAYAGGESLLPYQYVDGKGNISLPKNFRAKWVHLGSWVVPAQTDPGSGFHDVYTQPESFKYYMKNKKFPDGAILVKEIRNADWDEMPTGHVITEGDVKLWFVMVKDGKGRFKGNPNWGDGWGWALFKADNPAKNTSTVYKENCLSCHDPAKDTDWVYVKGYPTLR